MRNYPEQVISLAESVQTAGGRAMLVGGCVRDELMGIESKDWDIEVYGIEPDELKTLLEELGTVNVVGEAFTVYKLGLLDRRRDSKARTQDGART